MLAYQILCLVFLVVTGASGVALNFAFIFVTVKHEELRKVYAFFLCCVSSMNLLYSLSNFLLQPFVLVMHVEANSSFCSAVGAVTSVTGLASSFSQGFVALNRFVAMYYAQKQAVIFSRRNNAFMALFTFLLALSVSVLLYKLGDIGFLGNTVCGPNIEKMTFWHISFFMAPLCVSNGICVFSGYKIWRLIKSHQQNTRMVGSRLQHAKDIVILILVELVVPTVLEAPLLLNCLLSNYVEVPKILLSLSVCLFITHPVMDPVIVVIVMKPYKTTLRKMWNKFRGITTPVEVITVLSRLAVK